MRSIVRLLVVGMFLAVLPFATAGAAPWSAAAAGAGVTAPPPAWDQATGRPLSAAGPTSTPPAPDGDRRPAHQDAGAGDPADGSSSGEPAEQGWSIVGSPNRPAITAETVNFLLATACVSAADCWAVGYHSGGRTPGGIALQTLIEHWDGTAWTQVASPNANTSGDNYLSDIACVSASACWAVGHYRNGGKWQTLIERWDGTAWAVVSSPNTDVAENNVLAGLACLSASDCWAVGYFNAGAATHPLVEHWDGTGWTIVESPIAPQTSPLSSSPWPADVLADVTCVSASDCWAVGYFFGGSAWQPLIHHWDGAAWTVVTSPGVLLTLNHFLTGVTCVSTSQCWTVGSYGIGIDSTHTLVQRWDGSAWSMAISPNATPTGRNLLSGVTCVSASQCWAVGTHDAGGAAQLLGVNFQTMIQRWDGTTWTIVDSADTSAAQANALAGLACVSPTECWAVGSSTGAAAWQTLAQRWNGTSWAVVSTPNATALADSVLADVTCVSESDCWGVGHDLSGSALQTLVQHWDGAAWTIVDSPNTSPTHDNVFRGVTCVSSTSCWAVGYHNLGSAWQTLSAHWDGESWTTVDSPNTDPGHFNTLSAVTCAAASDCWAVGSYSVCYYCPGSAWQTLMTHWDGTAWVLAASPNTAATQNNDVSDVACVSGTDCWAVGWFATDTGRQALVQHWDGTAWTIEPPSGGGSGAGERELAGVTCVSASACWAVGKITQDGTDQPLVQRWDGAAWTTVEVAAGGVLSGVSCASAAECWAVGHHTAGGVAQTLVSGWDGTTWSIAASPNTDTAQATVLGGVSCLPSSTCWAAGHQMVGRVSQTLTARYRGPAAGAG